MSSFHDKDIIGKVFTKVLPSPTFQISVFANVFLTKIQNLPICQSFTLYKYVLGCEKLDAIFNVNCYWLLRLKTIVLNDVCIMSLTLITYVCSCFCIT